MTHFGRKQADLVKHLGWDKARASFMWNGKQGYRRKDVAEVSEWLGIEPFELLMSPTEAFGLRRLRETALQIAAEAGREWAPAASNTDTAPPEKRGA
mgnify:CR=1 FL=1